MIEVWRVTFEECRDPLYEVMHHGLWYPVQDKGMRDLTCGIYTVTYHNCKRELIEVSFETYNKAQAYHRMLAMEGVSYVNFRVNKGGR